MMAKVAFDFGNETLLRFLIDECGYEYWTDEVYNAAVMIKCGSFAQLLEIEKNLPEEIKDLFSTELKKEVQNELPEFKLDGP